MSIEPIKDAFSVGGYTLATVFAFTIDNVSGTVAAVVGGLFIGISIALPRAMPAFEKAGAAWLAYCAKRDANKLAAWEANEAAHLRARLAEDELMRPTLTSQMESLKKESARIVAMAEDAREEAKDAKAESAAARQETADTRRDSAAAREEAKQLTIKLAERIVRHTDNNLDNIISLKAQTDEKLADQGRVGADTKAIVQDTAVVVHEIERVVVNPEANP